MRIAYLILTHSSPHQTARLVDALTSAASRFFVHLDAKSPLEPYAWTESAPQVSMVERRIPVHWGGYSQVEAILALMQAALHSGERFDRLVLLSGSCHPLRSVAYIEAFFAAHPDSEFIDLTPMPCAEAGKMLRRLRHHHADAGEPWLSKRTREVTRWLAEHSGLLTYRQRLRGMQPYGGHTWWALTPAACEHLLRFTREKPWFVRYFRTVGAPDEIYFHTILGNSPFMARRAKGLTYADWRAGGPSPAWLTAQHVQAFAAPGPYLMRDIYGQGEALFARKVRDEDQALAQALDSMRAGKDAAAMPR